MQHVFNFKWLFLLFLFPFNVLYSQQNTVSLNNKDFKLSIKLESDFVTISNIEGCGFISISFNAKKLGKPIGFYERGMFDHRKEKRPKADCKYASFSFTVERTLTGLTLRKLDSVYWQELKLDFCDKLKKSEYYISRKGIEIQK